MRKVQNDQVETVGSQIAPPRFSLNGQEEEVAYFAGRRAAHDLDHWRNHYQMGFNALADPSADHTLPVDLRDAGCEFDFDPVTYSTAFHEYRRLESILIAIMSRQTQGQAWAIVDRCGPIGEPNILLDIEAIIKGLPS